MSDVKLFECQDCSRIWDLIDLNENIPHLQERVSPGEVMPTGECGDKSCRALCHELEGDYASACPKCGGGVRLVGFTSSCDIPISEDGWGLADGSADTSDEVFRCNSCGSVPSEWVFKNMTRKDAIDKMKPVEVQDGKEATGSG